MNGGEEEIATEEEKERLRQQARKVYIHSALMAAALTVVFLATPY